MEWAAIAVAGLMVLLRASQVILALTMGSSSAGSVPSVILPAIGAAFYVWGITRMLARDARGFGSVARVHVLLAVLGGVSVGLFYAKNADLIALLATTNPVSLVIAVALPTAAVAFHVIGAVVTFAARSKLPFGA